MVPDGLSGIGESAVPQPHALKGDLEWIVLRAWRNWQTRWF